MPSARPGPAKPAGPLSPAARAAVRDAVLDLLASPEVDAFIRKKVADATAEALDAARAMVAGAAGEASAAAARAGAPAYSGVTADQATAVIDLVRREAQAVADARILYCVSPSSLRRVPGQ